MKPNPRTKSNASTVLHETPESRTARATKKVEPTPAGAHAKRSPSTLKYLEQCPGFKNRQNESAASDEGTMLHRYIELWTNLQHGGKYEGLKDQGNLRGADEKEAQQLWDAMSTEQQDIIEKLCGYLQPILETAEEVYTEIKIDLRPYHLPGCEDGTSDLVLVTCGGDTLHCFDWKFGKVEVEAPEDNVQFMAYLLGLLLRFKPKRLEMHCVQPRVDQSIGHAIFTAAEVSAFLLRVKTIVERAEEMDKARANMSEYIGPDREDIEEFVLGNLSPQTSLCEYCAYIGTCPAVAAFALKITPKLELPPETDLAKLLGNPEGLGLLYAWSKLLQEKGESLQRHITEQALTGEEIAGYILQKAGGRNTVLDPVGLAEEIKRSLNFTDEQIYSCAEISLSKVVDIVSKNAPRGQKEVLAQEARKNLLDGGFFKSSAGSQYLKKTK